jgi:hypothetical protein
VPNNHLKDLSLDTTFVGDIYFADRWMRQPCFQARPHVCGGPIGLRLSVSTSAHKTAQEMYPS